MYLTPDDVSDVALGCAVLGSGGGGDVEPGARLLRFLLERHGTLEVVSPAQLAPLTPVALAGAVGSPTVMVERLPGPAEFAESVRALERHTGDAFGALCPLEIGGINGLLGACAASALGVPLIDGDAMGRAYPGLDQTVLMGVVPAVPMALVAPNGATFILDRLEGSPEQVVRAMLPAIGGWAAACLHPCDAARIAEHGVAGSVSRARRVGRGTRARLAGYVDDDEWAEVTGGRLLFTGTVAEVVRGDGGGVLTLHREPDDGRSLRVDFAEEFISAQLDGVRLAVAPELVVLVHARTWRPVGPGQLRAAQRVRVLSFDAPEPTAGLDERFGPASYGFQP